MTSRCNDFLTGLFQTKTNFIKSNTRKISEFLMACQMTRNAICDEPALAILSEELDPLFNVRKSKSIAPNVTAQRIQYA